MQLLKLSLLFACFTITACMNTTQYHSTTHDTQTQGAAGNLDANVGTKGSASASPNPTSTPAYTPH